MVSLELIQQYNLMFLFNYLLMLHYTTNLYRSTSFKTFTKNYNCEVKNIPRTECSTPLRVQQAVGIP